MKGLFVTFEGIEGSGKSTQIALLKDLFISQGEFFLSVKEPGTTGLGEILRKVLLEERTLFAETTLFLFMACRAQLVREVIKPALAMGNLVICDRFSDSSLAYQGFAQGISLDRVEFMNNIATDGLKPDITILIDLPPEVLFQRLSLKYGEERRDLLDSFEERELDFHRKVREGYLTLARRDPERIKTFNGNKDKNLLHSEIKSLLLGMMEKNVL